MKKYEIMVILQPKLSEPLFKKVITEIEKKIDGKIVQKEEIGLKKLSYQIKKQDEGFYILYYVETKPENIIEIKTYFNFSKEILRGLILSHEKKFPFELKTSKELKFPERKARVYDGKSDYRRHQRPLTDIRKEKTTSTTSQSQSVEPKTSEKKDDK